MYIKLACDTHLIKFVFQTKFLNIILLVGFYYYVITATSQKILYITDIYRI